MSAKAKNKTVRLSGALGVTTVILCASMLALFSGGLSVLSASVWILSAVFIWIILDRAYVAGAIWAIAAAVLGVGGLQVFGLLPPPLSFSGLDINWVMYAIMAAIGVGVLGKLRWSARARAWDRAVRTTQPQSHFDADNVLGDVAVIDVTPLGRIRRIFGNAALCPDMKPGQLFETAALDDRRITLQAGPDGQKVLVFERVPPEIENLRQEFQNRTTFFAGLGHDLKSPLNAVIGFADMMDSEISGPMPPPYREYPGLIKESGESLLRLVEDILDYARSEAGTLEMEFDVLDVAASGDAVMRQSQAMAKLANVALDMDAQGEMLAIADASAIRRVWDNLISNAIKYTPSGGRVRLSVRRAGAQIVLAVSDEGIGMDEADLARIAAPFAQGANAKGRAGTGLGLAMVRRLTQLHGGQMKVETAPGEGTRVSVSIPAAQMMERAAE